VLKVGKIYDFLWEKLKIVDWRGGECTPPYPPLSRVLIKILLESRFNVKEKYFNINFAKYFHI
jgi:hypothetical protein